MAINWTTEQVLALAPDASSASAGKGLANKSKWSNLGRNESAVWGECQGSGSKPYQTRIELAEPAFKCTCPSRKFPCKHSLALFLLLAQNERDFAETEPPGWVADWLKSRADRAQKKSERAADAKPPDPEEQAKRQARRAGRVDEGVEELSLWLRDLVRHGLAWAQTQPMSFWNGMAARMVDAQAPGLARRIREMALTPAGGEGWHLRLLEQLGRVHLIVEAWRRLDRLDAAIQEDVRAAIGFTTPRETVMTQPPVADDWLVASHEVEEEDDGIRTLRLWLWGRATRKPALVLSFAHRAASTFDFNLPFGIVIAGKLAYYPSAHPTRALVLEHGEGREWQNGAGFETISAALDAYADALAVNPWLDRFPILIDSARLYRGGDRWMIADRGGKTLPVAVQDAKGWHGLALSGGHPCAIFGEWTGTCLNAKSIIVDGRLHQLAE